jgi:serine/threonine protein kinase
VSDTASILSPDDSTRHDAAADPSDDPVGLNLERYKLLEKIGEGGCGSVYVAEQTEPVRRRVAVKVIKLGMDTKAVVARFEAERQALAMMDHPNIAKILDGGITGSGSGRPYFVMELVRGVRITEYCDQAKLSIKERLDLFIKVCQAIQHAHQKGIVHRDIKPSNILIALDDGVPVPKVIDFGIAKAIEGRLTEATLYTQLHQFIGTPAYMSPEQADISGLDIDTRSDIYSLGVLLYELLTGTTPFNATELLAAGLDEMRKTIQEKEPLRPSTRFSQTKGEGTRSEGPPKTPNLEARIDSDLDWIVMKCLEKDRTRRYETANGLAADLKRHLAHEPVVARPPSAYYRFQRAFRRNRLAFSAGATVAAGLIITTMISTWQVFETRKARNAEKEQRLAAQAAQKKAESAEAAERLERVRADAEKLAAQRLLYAANMHLAGAA